MVVAMIKHVGAPMNQHIMRTNHDVIIPQVDGLDLSLNESRASESESSSLTRLMALTQGLNSYNFR